MAPWRLPPWHSLTPHRSPDTLTSSPSKQTPTCPCFFPRSLPSSAGNKPMGHPAAGCLHTWETTTTVPLAPSLDAASPTDPPSPHHLKQAPRRICLCSTSPPLFASMLAAPPPRTPSLCVGTMAMSTATSTAPAARLTPRPPDLPASGPAPGFSEFPAANRRSTASRAQGPAPSESPATQKPAPAARPAGPSPSKSPAINRSSTVAKPTGTAASSLAAAGGSPLPGDLSSALLRIPSQLAALCSATLHFLPPPRSPLLQKLIAFQSAKAPITPLPAPPVPPRASRPSRPRPKVLSPAALERRAKRLRERLRRLAHQHGRFVRLGVSVVHVASGVRAGVHQHALFPLASVSKLPLLLAALHRCSCSCSCHHQHEQGPRNVSLSTRLRMEESDKCIGSGILKKVPAPLHLSLQHCLQLMHSLSDNAAADLVARAVPLSAVKRFLQAHGLNNTSVHLTQRQAFLIALGQAPQFLRFDGEALAKAWSMLSLESRVAVARKTEAVSKHLSVEDLRLLEVDSEIKQKGRGMQGLRDDMAVAAAVDNYGSPLDTARLLLRLARGQLLAPAWTRLAHNIMGWQEFGARRIPFFLPRETVVTWHKTGSIMGVINAAGIVKGPDEGCHFTIAAFADSVHRRHEREAEYLIARATKLAYETWCS